MSDTQKKKPAHDVILEKLQMLIDRRSRHADKEAQFLGQAGRNLLVSVLQEMVIPEKEHVIEMLDFIAEEALSCGDAESHTHLTALITELKK